MLGGLDEELAADVDLYSVLDVPHGELLEGPPVAAASGVAQVSQADGGSDHDETEEEKEAVQPAPATPLGPFTSSAMAPISPLPAVSVQSSHDGSDEDEDTEGEAGTPPEGCSGAAMDQPVLQRGTSSNMEVLLGGLAPLAGQGPMERTLADKPAAVGPVGRVLMSRPEEDEDSGSF